MVLPDEIKWSSYGNYEGPFFRGSRRYELPNRPDDVDRYIAVTTAVESGRYDAINMYDSGIVSVGQIQWIESNQRTVTKLIGCIADENGLDLVNDHLAPALAESNASFTKSNGLWTFAFNDSRGDVRSNGASRELFLSCSGVKGSWSGAARYHAKLWASCLANLLATDGARRTQNTFTRDRMHWFVLPEARMELFRDRSLITDEGGDWGAAVRAAYVSFAVNRPSTALNQLIAAKAGSGNVPKWSPEWCTHLLRTLTFGPRIAIYPDRYDGIRPVIERFWNVKLPRTAEDLRAWQLPVKRAVQVPAEIVVEPIAERVKKNVEPIPLDALAVHRKDVPEVTSYERRARPLENLWSLVLRLILWIVGARRG